MNVVVKILVGRFAIKLVGRFAMSDVGGLFCVINMMRCDVIRYDTIRYD